MGQLRQRLRVPHDRGIIYDRNGRELARLCESHDVYRWIAGDVSLNYHTLNDFRVGHAKALDDLFTLLVDMRADIRALVPKELRQVIDAAHVTESTEDTPNGDGNG